MRKMFLMSFLLSTTLSVYSPVVNAVEANASENENQVYKVHLQDADIKAFVEQIATITHKTFVLDPKISGNITVFSEKKLSSKQIYDLFLTVMKVNGIKAIEHDNLIELIPDSRFCKAD